MYKGISIKGQFQVKKATKKYIRMDTRYAPCNDGVSSYEHSLKLSIETGYFRHALF